MKKHLLVAGLAAVIVAPASAAQVLTIDVTGIESFAGIDNPGNVIQFFDLGADTHIVGLEWDVTFEAFSPSWQSEGAVLFENSDLEGVVIRPGIGVNSPGVGSFSSNGVLDLVDAELDFRLGADGTLIVQFFETFVDFPDAPDGVWQSGTFSVYY